MTRTTVTVEAQKIDGAKALDPIHVFWIDAAPGKGYVTIICYGQAWTAYFGAMGGNTIREFFADCDTGYLATKMGITPHLKQSKKNEAYLSRIIDAVRESLTLCGECDGKGEVIGAFGEEMVGCPRCSKSEIQERG